MLEMCCCYLEKELIRILFTKEWVIFVTHVYFMPVAPQTCCRLARASTPQVFLQTNKPFSSQHTKICAEHGSFQLTSSSSVFQHSACYGVHPDDVK